MGRNTAHYKLFIEGDIDMTLVDDINTNLANLNVRLGAHATVLQAVEDGIDRLIVKIQELIDAGGATPAQLQGIMDEVVLAQNNLTQGEQIAQEALDKEASVT